MNHLDDGTLQAFLDDELPPDQRTGVAEHLLGCADCRAAKESLSQANETFSEKIALLDVAPHSGTDVPGRRNRALTGGAFVKAASLTLLLAAAASAAVPGSPVREWIARAVMPDDGDDAVVEQPAERAMPAPRSAPAGVAVAADGPVDVVLTGLEGTTIRLVETEEAAVAVSALGGQVDPVFVTGPGQLEVRDGEGGEVTVALPRSLDAARVLVDGRLYAEKVGGRLEIHVPAATVDGALVWR